MRRQFSYSKNAVTISQTTYTKKILLIYTKIHIHTIHTAPTMYMSMSMLMLCDTPIIQQYEKCSVKSYGDKTKSKMFVNSSSRVMEIGTTVKGEIFLECDPL